ncbi:MAG: glycosyltransferase family 1 protein [Bacteroidetes bacterium]|nr:glycosyltransferase family 1 protein [Bacteroidota bacterium]
MSSIERHIHIISFDVPFPPNYGGVIDVFFKVKALHTKGVKVHLHCFQYGREKAAILSKYCESIDYYPRNVAKSQLFMKQPYIVISRFSEQLLTDLLQDEYPILFEGIHTCNLLDNEKLADRIKLVRTHNIEHDYYQNLAKVESNIFKRYYFYNEANKLETFESVLQNAQIIAAISRNDTSYFDKKYGNAFYIPAFHSNEQTHINPGKGNFAFYHGNLAIGENNEAALYLVNEVFNNLKVPLIIAGSRPTSELRGAVARKNNITLISDLTTKQIHQLINDAHVNILPTFQPTGIKLKLLSALYNGRFALVNPMMVENTGLEMLCEVAENAVQMREKLIKLMEIDFRVSDIKTREKVLNENFSNGVNAQKLIDLTFSTGKGLFPQF